MKIKYLSVVGLLGWCSIANMAQAQDHTMSVVSSAVPMLRVSPDARAGGMGDAAIAVAPDATAIFWNRSKLPFASTSSALSLTYSPWISSVSPGDVFLASLGGYTKIGDEQALSVSLRYFSLGEVQYSDENGQRLQTTRPNEYAIDAGYSRMLSKKISVGLALRYINSGLASGYAADGYTYKKAHAVAGDVSFYYHGLNESGAGWTAGLALSNLGSKVSYSDDAAGKDFLPANLGLGGAYTFRLQETGKLTFALDLNKLMVPTPPEDKSDASMQAYRSKTVFNSWFSSFGDAPGGFSEELKEWQISTGVEYWYEDLLAIRGGYFYENRLKGGRQYATVGLGMKYHWLGANFSYLIPTGKGILSTPTRQTLRVSLLFDVKK